MKNKIVIIVLGLMCSVVYAQQDAQYTQYMYNTINVNPAYAGSRGVMSLFGLHRTQWVGLDGAPVTNAFSLNSPINNSNLGVGLSFVNDKIGPTNENTISVDVSYSVQTSENYKLSFGIKGTANLFNLDVNKLNPANAGDPQFQNLSNNFTPNFGAGIYLHSNKTYIGLSVPNFFENVRYSENDVAISKERMNFYLIGGHVFDLSPSLKFKPAFLAKAVEGAPLQLDVSGNFLINEKFVLGAAWRWDAALSGMAGFQISDQLFLGYGYDLETTRLRNYNSGSHEVFLRVELFTKHNKIVSPRFF
ncbi:PorP/SprF family type IX secretion system membrane protein [Flavobacterium sp.]|uniref:PorP/SprF family type IX secretion system membrane protein n=1 Tax=Flavobacterium sp. TaxID=239 RepID=UPI002FDB146A